MYLYFPVYMFQSIKGETQVAEKSVWVLHSYLSENSNFDISIRGHINRLLTLIQFEFSIDTQCYVLLKYVTNPNVG